MRPAPKLVLGIIASQYLFLPCHVVVSFQRAITWDRRNKRLATTTCALQQHPKDHSNSLPFGNLTTTHMVESPFIWSDSSRRSLLWSMGIISPLVTMLGGLNNQNKAWAALPFGKRPDTTEKNKVFFVGSSKNASDSLQRVQADLGQCDLTSEQCLLKLLPVKNPIFRGLEKSVLAIFALKNTQEYAIWNKAKESLLESIAIVDTKRSKLEPIFNPEEDTMIQIIKGERGEQLIEAFRQHLVDLANATAVRNATQVFRVQKKALLALADVGGE